MDNLEAVISIFEKIFDPVKNFAVLQLDKASFQALCLEAYNSLASLAQVRTINEFDRSVSLYNFYVAPQVTSLDSMNGTNKVFTVEKLEDFATPKKVLISGIVGQGKSILMKNLAIRESFKKEKFPIFSELRELEENESLENFMYRTMSSILGLENQKLHTYLLKEGKVTFFFDGFDEVKTSNMGRIVKEFEKLEKKFPYLDFIVSSRPEETIDKSTIFSKFLINKLNLEGQIKIIEKLTDENLIKVNLINNLKKSNEDIHGVLVTPLMVNFYFYLYKTEQITGNNITLFYNQLFDLTLRKHDGTKLIYSRDYVTGLQPEELQAVFECICFLSCKQKTFFFSEYNFREIVEKAIKFKRMKCSINDLIRDLTTGICFICREGQSYAFLHTSIPEFFGAKFVLNNIHLEGLIDKIIDNYQDYINLISYMKTINEKEFYLNFLKPIFQDSAEFFKTKRILDNIYISSKLYDKNKKNGNVINVLTVFDSNVHPYFVFDFREFIKPFLKKHIDKKYIRRKKTNYQFFWTPRAESSNNKDEIIQSENYFLHERIDNSSNSISKSSTRKALQLRIQQDEFKAITETYSQRAETIESALNQYILRLKDWKNKIEKYENVNIEELF
ncbi:NACHT domain-containing protein [Acinetobacter baumannii]|uniref:NACHT domain-containing protein n=1 Tax=Acinetobacter baumannii TaxID=470 RepID=UPI0010FD6E9C|nr:NACHT domain-containing protein [Acinetobacter baumannii]MDK1591961.1 NACHT domain-containing protein [Acinetobacter baumannii]MZY88845.1 NACHT domain-containing protein [Acinetobacter baumannii]NAS41431.1 NACHT domain-containing protein [Acinetobacter baumannii]TLT82926.1 NACHT domain-containing protein [Acinetobacter baumannii]HDX5932842.1 NACHT domain-containing protein [Acinetobacter baumannii]